MQATLGELIGAHCSGIASRQETVYVDRAHTAAVGIDMATHRASIAR
jgi:hypothetical protein